MARSALIRQRGAGVSRRWVRVDSDRRGWLIRLRSHRECNLRQIVAEAFPIAGGGLGSGQTQGQQHTGPDQRRPEVGIPLEYHGRDRLSGALVHRLVGPPAAVAGDQARHARLTVVPKQPFDAPCAEVQSQRRAWLNACPASPGWTPAGAPLAGLSGRAHWSRVLFKAKGSFRIVSRQPDGFGLTSWKFPAAPSAPVHPCHCNRASGVG